MFSWFEKQLSPFPDDASARPPNSLAAFCWHYVKDAKWWLVATAVLSALIAIAEVALFGFLGQLVDWLAVSEREGFFAREGAGLLLMGGFLLFGLPLLVMLDSLVTHQTLMGNLPMIARWRMHRLLLGQSLSFFADEFAGRVSTKLMQTALAVRETTLKLLDIFVYIAVYFISVIALAAAADWRLAAPLLIWLGIYCSLIAYFVPRLKKISERQADARSTMTGRIVDSYTNITTVKLFSHTRREEAYARDAMGGFLKTVYAQMRYATSFYALVYFNNCVLIFAIAALAIWLWAGAAVSVGAIAIVIALALRLNGMSHWIMWEVSNLFENIGVMHDGMMMLNKRVSVTNADQARPLQVTAGAIDFDKVSFNYDKISATNRSENEQAAPENGPLKLPVIQDFSLSIAPGEKIGLVGRSGAGKTTLTNLLLRFYDVERGEIMIDGQNVAAVTQESLRAAIGVVTQDTGLLHRSIRDNVAYSQPDADDEAIMEALRRANADQFIADLSDGEGRSGLDAHVGERGVKLSGGQRQRIAIARVFLKNAPVLILDEATSALDSEVEAAIQESLFTLMEGKTVIAIAHRLSTIAAMDRLIVLDQGAIVEEGSHKTLIAKGGLYADLWARQSGGFIDTQGQVTAGAAQ